VPASESETGKRVSKYFATKELAETFITEHHKVGSIHFAELSTQERAVLAVMRQSDDYSPETLLDLWRNHKAAQQARKNSGFRKSRSLSCAKRSIPDRSKKNAQIGH
jgi:hypothetical protein